jgi:hypothetical protein
MSRGRDGRVLGVQALVMSRGWNDAYWHRSDTLSGWPLQETGAGDGPVDTPVRSLNVAAAASAAARSSGVA